MENWRLSKIEEELGMLKLDLGNPDVVPPQSTTAAGDVLSPGRTSESYRIIAKESDGDVAGEEDLSSRIIIRPAYRRPSRKKTEANKAVQLIKEKYDSPNSMTTRTTRTLELDSPPGAAGSNVPPQREQNVPRIWSTPSSPPSQEVQGQGVPRIWNISSSPPSQEVQGQGVPRIWNISSTPPSREIPEQDVPRIWNLPSPPPSQDVIGQNVPRIWNLPSVAPSQEVIGQNVPKIWSLPSTPPPQEVPGQNVTWNQPPQEISTMPLQFVGTYPAARDVKLSSFSQPSEDRTLSRQKSSKEHNGTAVTLPPSPKGTPAEVYLERRASSRLGPPTAAKPPSNFYQRCSPSPNQDSCKTTIQESNPQPLSDTLPVNPGVLPPDTVMVKPAETNGLTAGVNIQGPLLLPQNSSSSYRSHSDTPDVNSSDFHSGWRHGNVIADDDTRQHDAKNATVEVSTAGSVTSDICLERPNYSDAPPKIRQSKTDYEFVSMETRRTQNLTNSYNCFPRFGTLKASRTTSHSETKSELFPPGGSCLSDEDYNQVEMFYRSHKTRVFVARCQANLYFGSARRHSVIFPSKSATNRTTESPENWLYIKCGIPVLILDTGESRRQRKLHIILAEKGSGFVLWRDTVDHLTCYSMSTNVGFHTMHLSKDHSKLAGFYFCDTLSATEFHDYLSNLTSDPDDPLLNLSNGARKKKDRKVTSANRKEKRKPIKREDISLPCCFTHVTKLDRADGLNIMESDQPLPEPTELDDPSCVAKTPLYA